MRVIARRTPRGFADSIAGQRDHLAVKSALDSWFAEVSRAAWANSTEVKKLYATASIVNAERVVFNIKGNDYRLIVAIDYDKGIIWIKWIGNHKAYDKVNAAEVSYDN
jgi:mRNA interferase HigB